MIDIEIKARIRHLFHAEHWKIGTIAAAGFFKGARIRSLQGSH